MPTQSSPTILMVRPARFGFNAETAENNAFQQPAQELNVQQVADLARKEFDGMVATMRAAGVEVIVVEDEPLPIKPDAVFPNNWFTTHDDGLFIRYPLYSPMRRRERELPVRETLAERFRIEREWSLEHYESENRFLEGTGSLVLDRMARVAYLCRSIRSEEKLTIEWAAEMGYRAMIFDALDPQGQPIYHTNVMMAVGTEVVPICLTCIAPLAREAVRKCIEDSGKDVLELSWDQIMGFAGNMLEVVTPQGPRWAMSSQAYRALQPAQRDRLERQGPIIHAPIDAIEQLGGGSARCMMAEIFLPRR